MNQQSTSAYNLLFGHYIGKSDFQINPPRWNRPGTIQIKEKYLSQSVTILRPREGVTTITVTCDVCGETFQFEARSIRHILAHYFKTLGVAILLAVPCSIATFFMGGYPSIVFFIVIGVLLLVVELPEIFGRSDHHSPIVSIDSLSGHKLLWVQKA
jgi:hypothetical protein